MPFDDDRFDAFEDHGELGGTDENDHLTGLRECDGKAKTSGFEAFVPKSVAVTVPVEDFEPVSRTIDEDEEGPVERVLLETVFDDGGESVERFSHVDGTCRNVNGAGKAVQHDETSSCRTISHRILDGISTGKRSVNPFFVTSSIVRDGDDGGRLT